MLEYSILVLTAAVIGGGVLGAVIRAWSLQSQITSHLNRIGTLEGAYEDLRTSINVEVKRRAGEARQAQRRTAELDKQELAVVASNVKGADSNLPWWAQRG